jgi:hypothetical protein
MNTITVTGLVERINFNPSNNWFSYLILKGKVIEVRAVDHGINKLLALTEKGDVVQLRLRPSYTPPETFDLDSVERMTCDLLSFHNETLGKAAGEEPSAEA